MGRTDLKWGSRYAAPRRWPSGAPRRHRKEFLRAFDDLASEDAARRHEGADRIRTLLTNDETAWATLVYETCCRLLEAAVKWSDPGVRDGVIALLTEQRPLLDRQVSILRQSEAALALKGGLTAVNGTGPHLVNLDLSGGNLASAHLDGATMWKVNLSEATLDGSILRYGAIAESNLRAVSIRGADLTGTSFHAVALDRSHWEATRATATFFSEVVMESATLYGCDLSRVSMLDTHLDIAKVVECHLGGGTFGRTYLERSWIEGSSFERSTFIDSWFEWASITYTAFVGAELTNVTFDGAHLDFTSFLGATLRLVEFGQAEMGTTVASTLPPDAALTHCRIVSHFDEERWAS